MRKPSLPAGVLLGLGVFVLGCSGRPEPTGSTGPRPSELSGGPGPEGAAGGAAESPTGWSLDARKLQFPNTPVQGKIYLCLPDPAHSFVAGTFTLDAAGIGYAAIKGRVSLKGHKEYRIHAGYVGTNDRGQDKSGGVGVTVTPGNDATISSFASRL